MNKWLELDRLGWDQVSMCGEGYRVDRNNKYHGFLFYFPSTFSCFPFIPSANPWKWNLELDLANFFWIILSSKWYGQMKKNDTRKLWLIQSKLVKVLWDCDDRCYWNFIQLVFTFLQTYNCTIYIFTRIFEREKYVRLMKIILFMRLRKYKIQS